MRIESISSDSILFDNGDIIGWEHFQDCCEEVYADFQQLDDLARSYNYSENLIFEEGEYGFCFGDKRRMFFVPCYNIQNGHYSGVIEVYYWEASKNYNQREIVLTYDTPMTGHKY